MTNGLLILEDGTQFRGVLIGSSENSTGELCLFTGMSGYQEAFTDPSYFGQIIVMSNAHIGNYGWKDGESESEEIQVSGVICRNLSNYNSRKGSKSLIDVFKKANKTILKDVDTRAVVNHLRKYGNMNGVICVEEKINSAIEFLKNSKKMSGRNVSSELKKEETTKCFTTRHSNLNVGLFDFGVKENIVRELMKRGCCVTVYNQNSLPETYDMDGYLISNGPGDPASMKEEIEAIKRLVLSKKPIFGICLGHQLLALSQGLETYKMHTGHRGCNHAVLNVQTGKAEVTSQNHGFAVKEFKREDIEVTHLNLNDGTVEGLRLKNYPAFSVQHHPEACAGPHDSSYLFNTFIKMMQENI